MRRVGVSERRIRHGALLSLTILQLLALCIFMTAPVIFSSLGRWQQFPGRECLGGRLLSY
jgi:hypothetical protein